MQSTPWYTPFRIMLIIFILLILFDVVFLTTYKLSISLTGQMLFFLIIWPVVVLGEVILYWVLRKKIKERKLVWVHLLFSLFAFVVLKFIIVLLTFITRAVLWRDHIYYVQLIGFWGSIIIGHTSLIVAIVRSYSAKDPQPPNDDNDLLSEFTV
jgi:hypothetical protein